MGGAGLPLTPFPAVLRSLRALDPSAWGLPLSAANARATWVDAVDALEAADRQEAVTTPLPGTPPRRVVIVCSANVYVAPLPWLAQLCLRGVEVRLKPARGQELAIRAMAGCFPGTEVRVWRGGDVEAETAALADVDAVIAFGGAEALDAIQSRLPPGVVWLPFGPRFGVAVVDTVTEALALDHALFDGQGCMSPAAVFVRRLDDAAVERAAATMAAAEQRLPRAALDPVDAVAVRTRLLLARARGEVRVGPAWAVLVLPAQLFSVVGLPRVMTLHPWTDLAEVEAILHPWAHELGSIALDDATRARLAATPDAAVSLPTLSRAPRHALPGEMQRPEAGRWHDGVDVLGALWRIPGARGHAPHGAARR